MRTITLSLLSLAAGVLSGLSAQMPSTHIFSIADGDTLRMDVYRPEECTAPTPAVLFAFGGSFTHGNRADKEYLEYFRFLVRNGISVISTDYRTSLAKATPATLASPQGFATALGDAITDAVTDFYTATGYVLAHSGEWNIDPAKIIASGSSAGAITALQAEYGIANGMMPENTFPAGFNYAGTVTFAGAICAQGEFEWASKPCPMMLFHGNADSTVPYGSVSVGPMSLNGSGSIAGSLAKLGMPYAFYTVASADHSVAISPMHDNLYDIVGFIMRTVSGKTENTLVATEQPVNAPADYKTDFTLDDYIRSNTAL